MEHLKYDYNMMLITLMVITLSCFYEYLNMINADELESENHENF